MEKLNSQICVKEPLELTTFKGISWSYSKTITPLRSHNTHRTLPSTKHQLWAFSLVTPQRTMSNMKLVQIDYQEVATDCKNPDVAQNFNTSFHTTKEADLPRPEETPYSFGRWLPLILETRNLEPSQAQVISLSPAQTRLLLTAASASIATRMINQAYMEDIKDEIIDPGLSKLSFPDCGLFMRLDQCSPKDGRQSTPGKLSLHSAMDIVLRLTTSQRACSSLVKSLELGNSNISLFFLPFNDRMKSEREYRVFCQPHDGKIAAISQYCWHKPWLFANLPVDERNTLVNDLWTKIQTLHGQIMENLRDDDELDSLLLKQGFSFDTSYDETTKAVELVELNVFGARSGCGSCLFHWIKDLDVLYGKTGEVEFRVAW